MGMGVEELTWSAQHIGHLLSVTSWGLPQDEALQISLEACHREAVETWALNIQMVLMNLELCGLLVYIL